MSLLLGQTVLNKGYRNDIYIDIYLRSWDIAHGAHICQQFDFAYNIIHITLCDFDGWIITEYTCTACNIVLLNVYNNLGNGKHEWFQRHSRFKLKFSF